MTPVPMTVFRTDAAPVTTDAVDSPVSEVGQLVSTIATWALALVVIALVARVCVRRRSWVPAIVLAGGGATFLLEPMFDHFYGLWFQSQGQWTMFTVYGIHLPVWLPAAYIAYYGGGAVLVAEKLRTGWGAREVQRFYAANVALAVIAEVAYIKVLGVYEYQDSQPWLLLGYPMFLAFVNSVSPVVAGVLAHRLEGMLSGAMRLTLFYAVPVCFVMEACGGGFLYLAYRHSTETPNMPLTWLLSAVAAGTAVLMVKIVSQLAPAAVPSEPRAATAAAG
jgi:hypothetical protein